MGFKSIKTKLGVLVGMCCLAIIAFLVVYTTVYARNQAVAAAKTNAVAAAREYANHFAAEIESGLDTARTFAQAFSAVRDPEAMLSIGRIPANAILKKILKENKNLVGLFMVWEPDSFDLMDDAFAGIQGYDSTGRFAPYWYRDEHGKLQFKAVEGYLLPGPDNIYLEVKEVHKETITEPRPMKAGKIQRSVIQLISPVMLDDKFFGVAGVELPLDLLQKMVETAHPYDGRAAIAIITNRGTIAAYSGNNVLPGDAHDMILKPLDKLHPEKEGFIRERIEQGAELVQIHNQNLEIFSPIRIGKTTTPWSVSIVVPYPLIVESAERDMWRKIAFSGLMGALAVVIIVFFIGRMIKPVKSMSEMAEQVAQGDLDVRPIAAAKDEVGKLSESMENIVSSLRSLTSVSQSIAAGDYSRSFQTRGPKDALGTAVNKMIENLKAAHEDTSRKIAYLDNIPTPVHVVDLDLNIQFVNRVGAELLGMTQEDCLNHKCEHLFHSTHCSSNLCPAAKVIRDGEVVTGQTALQLKDRTLPIRYTVAPIYDKDGKVTGIIEYIVDISAEIEIIEMADRISEGDYSVSIKKRSESDRLAQVLNRMAQKLREAVALATRQNRLKTAQMELSRITTGQTDQAVMTRDVIRFVCQHTGAQMGAFYVKSSDEDVFKLTASYAFQKRRHHETRYAPGQGLVGQAALEKQRMVVTGLPEDYVFIHSGLGEAPPKELTLVPLVENETVEGVLEIGTLNPFSEYEIAFFDAISGPIAVSLRAARSSMEMALLLEKTQTQAEELQVQQEELRQANEELEEQTEALKSSELVLQEQQEELRQTNEELQEQTRLLEEQKESVQKKNLELEMARNLIEDKAKDLARSSRYKSEFLANMSHELRTPLNSILLLSRMLSDNKDHTLTDKQMEFAQTIHASGSDLLTLINEILDLSKVEAGKMTFHFENLNLRFFSSSTHKKFEPLSMEKNLEFKVALGPSLPETIRTDRQRVEQIIKNFLSNAFKFTRKGSVTLNIDRPAENEMLPAQGLEPDATVRFTVRDSGIGIPKDKQDLIFEAFQQADGATTRKYGGTGLGLSISRELARCLGGGITLESRHGEGSAFSLYLPDDFQQDADASTDTAKMVPDPAPRKKDRQTTGTQAGAPSDTPSDFQGGRQLLGEIPTVEMVADDRKNLSREDKSILIIEDDPKFSKVLRDLSQERGFKVLVAGDGETGLHFADYYRPSAVILDVGLPGMDGWTVMNRLKENAATRHIPVHFISAVDKTLDAMKMGAVGYITKPVSMEKVEEVFSKLDGFISKAFKELLIIEDDQAQRRAVSALLGNGDIRITGVGTGDQAMKELIKGNYDCIVLDLGLPDMPGVELLKQIRNHEDLCHIPIIIYTGKELSKKEEITINEYAEKIIIKGAKSPEKLIDETTLFLHRVESKLPRKNRELLAKIHDKESILKDKKILLVDDDMRNVYALTNILEQNGMKVMAGINGKNGIEKLKANPDTDLVLMDIMMPEMDGYQAMDIIRKDKQFARLPIIALTAKAMKGDRAKCIEAGASDYLAKPVDTDKLLSMLRVWLY